MTIENLKQIAIKYASTKGSRIPLAPDELCNAVVQYMNSFFGVMADINTIKVAVTEDSGNIVFTITGNTYDGKPITPIVITVDHNDFVTDQEFEEFKESTNTLIQKNTDSINNLGTRVDNASNDIVNLQTRVGNAETDITEINSTLSNKVDKIVSPVSDYVVYVQVRGNEENITYSESALPNTIMYRRSSNGGSKIGKGISGDDAANMENIQDVLNKIPDVSGFIKNENSNSVKGGFQLIGPTALRLIGVDSTNQYRNLIGSNENVLHIAASKRPDIDIAGTSTEEMAFLSDIPAYTTVDSVSYDTTNGAIIAYDGAHEIHIPLQAGENVTIDASEDNKKIVISAAGGGGTGDVTAAGNNIFTGENEFRNYTYATSNFCFVGTKEDYLTNGYTTTIKNGGFDISYYENGEGKYWTTYADNQIINKDIDMEGEVVIKFPKKEGTFALTSDIPDTSSFVTLAGNNTFTGVNTFNNSIYAKNGVVAENTTNYGANSIRKGPNTYSFPNKSGTFAMTTDVIKNPIYFISFYANEPSGPCHLIGTMMSKNSYVTGQKTNEEFAVMLADNLYTNSNEGLAAYGRLAGKDILCIYSEDGLSIRCLNEENSEVDLPTVMFFVMETEL